MAEAVRRTAGTSRLSVASLAAAVLALTACAASGHHGDRSGTVFAAGDDRLPSRTASDWVTYADAVVVVTPRREAELGPAKAELANGEGVITRELTLRVDRVLWSRPDAARPVPTSFAWTAFGWTFHGDPGNRVEMASPGSPRIELGHTYVMAVEWEPATCPDGDDALPAQWLGLGDGSTLPYDSGILGHGEIAGKSPVERSRRDADDPNFGLADAVTGRPAQDLVDALRSAHARKNDKFTYLPTPTPCRS